MLYGILIVYLYISLINKKQYNIKSDLSLIIFLESSLL